MNARLHTVCLVLLLGIASAASATEARSLFGVEDIFYFYDPDAAMDANTLRNTVIAQKRYSSFDSTETAMGRGDHWVFFDVASRETGPGNPYRIEIDFPNIDRIEATVFYDNGKTGHFVTGDEVAFNEWPIDYRKPSIPLTHLDESNASVYLRIKSETPLILPLALVTQQEQNEAQLNDNFIYGIFYGAIFILAIYNAGVYFSLRDKSYRFYILYILSFSLVQASTTGMGQQHLWPELPDATTRIALLAIIFTHYFMAQFVIHFLDLDSFRPAALKPLKWSANFALLLAPTLLLPQYAYTQYAVHVANVLGMISILAATISALGHNARPAVYLIISYTILFSAIVLALLFQADFIAHHAYIDFSMSAAIMVEAIILSIGLSDRIAQLRNNNESAERELRMSQEQLSQQLIHTREKERSEISRLLHDSVNHDLVVVQKKLGQLANVSLTRFDKIEQELAPIDELLNKVIQEVRSISHLKHPQMVKHLGLQTALEALVESSFDDSLTVNVHVEDIPLPYDAQLFLYRAAQEATTNIIKHANATECILRLFHDDDTGNIVFLIRDDGVGFDAKGRNWGFGLRTLNEYCKSLGGTLTIGSSTQDGTTLAIVLPESLRSQT